MFRDYFLNFETFLLFSSSILALFKIFRKSLVFALILKQKTNKYCSSQTQGPRTVTNTKIIYWTILDLNLLTAGVYCSSAPTACTSLTNCSLDLIKMAAKKCNQFQNATNVSDKTTTLQFWVFIAKTDIFCRKWIFAS